MTAAYLAQENERLERELAKARALLALVHGAFTRKVPDENAEQDALADVDDYLTGQVPDGPTYRCMWCGHERS